MEVDRGFPFGQHLSFEDFLVDLNEFYGNKEYESLNDFERTEQYRPDNHDLEDITEHDHDYQDPARLEIGDEREEPDQVQHKDDEFNGNSENGSDKADWQNNDEWRVGPVNDHEGSVIQEMVINREKADQVQQEENQLETTTHQAAKEKRKYLKIWNFLQSLPTLPPKVLGLRTYKPIVKKKSKDKTLSLSDDIFSNWEKPDVRAPLRDDFEKVDIKKMKAKLPVNLKPVPKIKRRRKRKKNTKTQKTTEKSSNMQNEVTPTKQSLYKWYQKMKESGRFNF
jgi:hypothetical protein